jgi:hypothetical protein
MEIRKERGFPQQLEKASHKTLSFFTVPTGPATRIFNIQNSLQAVIYLKKAKFRSEEWGAPHTEKLLCAIRCASHRRKRG